MDIKKGDTLSCALIFFLAFMLLTWGAAAADLNPDTEGLLKLLHDRRFDRLNEVISAYQQAYSEDTNKEQRLIRMLEVFATSNPEWDAPLDEWVRKYPASYPARVARGIHRCQQGWRWRGEKFSRSTPAIKFERMQKAFDLASEDLIASLQLTEKPVVSLQWLISMARTASGRTKADAWLKQAIKVDPAAYGARYAYLYKLYPRWGGSHLEMQAFADDLRKVGHPKLDMLVNKVEASILVDMGDQSRWAGDDKAAENYYLQANRHYAYSVTRLALGNLYIAMKKDDLAAEQLHSALRDAPHFDAVMAKLAGIYLRKKDYANAMQYMEAAASFGNAWAVRNLAHIAMDGRYGQPVDIAKGIRMLERSAYFLDGYSLFALGNIHEKGYGVPADKARAQEYYELGVKLNDPYAQNNLGLMLWQRNSTQDDRRRAVLLWQEAAAQGHRQAKQNLERFAPPEQR